MPIVNNTRLISGHEFILLAEDVVAVFKEASAKSVYSNRGAWITFEAYLQLAKRPAITMGNLHDGHVTESLCGYLGALHSPMFIPFNESGRVSRSYGVLFIARQLGIDGPWDEISLSHKSIHEPLRQWAQKFEALDLDPDVVWLWEGWGGQTKDGRAVYFPLYPVYKRVGRKFTEQFALVLRDVVSGRSASTFKCLGDFCRYFESYGGELTAENFRDPYWTGRFFNGFGRHFFEQMKSRGNGIRCAALGWSSYFLPMVKALVSAHVIADPQPALGAPRAGVVVTGAETRLKKDATGVVVKRSALTPIPIELDDSEARDILFRAIQDDFGAVVTWAERGTRTIWERHIAAREAAKSGLIRQKGSRGDSGRAWLLDPANPKFLANAAATYLHYGFSDLRLNQTLYAQCGLLDIAWQLGIPLPGSLLPHAALLVANHCEITSEFLSGFELYDKTGRRHGFQEGDGGDYLVGYKRRKGPDRAEQRIRLTARSSEVVRQVIELTEPLRHFLKAAENPHWRRLFLTARGMKSVPMPQDFANQCSKPENNGSNSLRSTFASVPGLATGVAEELANTFSLRALRVSSALNVYVKTESAHEMSRALGHDTYDPKLLDRYLPEPIQRFFRDRWIRIFQTGIICEAMQDSPHLLEATGLASMDIVDEFLKNHALKSIPDGCAPKKEDSQQKVVIDVSPPVLGVLLAVSEGVSRTVGRASACALYWAEFAKRLENYMALQVDRPDILNYLQLGREQATGYDLRELVCV